MPKKSLKIDRFEGGLANYHNPKDIDDNALVEAKDIMVDILGKIRLMGKSDLYTPPGSHIGPLHGLTALVKPGYGLFSFGADHNIGDEEIETKIIAIQSEGKITLFDLQQAPEAIELTNDSQLGMQVEPSFFYLNNALRISDGFFEEVGGDDGTSTPAHDAIENVWYGFIKRTMFGNDSSNALAANFGWTQERQAVTGNPDVEIADGPPAIDLGSNPDAGSGAIGCILTFSDDTDGEWNDAELTSLSFGYSLLYDDDEGFGKQESPIRKYGGSAVSIGGSVDKKMTMTIKINKTEATDFSGLGFPNRVTGFRIYWMGEGGANDLFEDPLILATGHFNRGVDNEGVVVAHSNQEQLLVGSGSYFTNTSALDIVTQPALTYELTNFYKHNVAYTTARYKTSVIVNNICYIGHIRQGGRTYADRMIKSPVGKFDIYPSTNFLEVAIGDGDAIVALAEYSDRILQFKKESLYIINVSGDYEYVEDHQLYMGVNSPAAITKMANGIAWINQYGCYIYNGESIQNIISNKIDPSEWKAFVGTKGMLGYLSKNQQLIATRNPNSFLDSGDIFIYDIRTKSWTKGINKLPLKSKSNFISTYLGELLIASNYGGSSDGVSSEYLNINQDSTQVNKIDGEWTIPNLSNATGQNMKLQINSIDITPSFSYDLNSGISLQQAVKDAIVNNGNLHDNALEVSWSNEILEPNPLRITMDGDLTNVISKNFSTGTMAWVNPPTGANSITFTPHTVQGSWTNLYGGLQAIQKEGEHLWYYGEVLRFRFRAWPSEGSMKDKFHVELFSLTMENDLNTNILDLIGAPVTVTGLNTTVDSEDISFLNKEYTVVNTSGHLFGDHLLADIFLGSEFSEDIYDQWNNNIFGNANLTRNDLHNKTCVLTGRSASIYKNSVGEYWTIDAIGIDRSGEFQIGDVITTSFTAEPGSIEDSYNGKQFAILSWDFQDRGEEAAQIQNDHLIVHTLGRNLIRVTPVGPLPSNNTANIMTNFTISKESQDVEPDTISTPVASVGSKYIGSIYRYGLLSGGSEYRLAIDSNNNIYDEAIYTTSTNDTPSEVASGIVASVTANNWVGKNMISSIEQISMSAVELTFTASGTTIRGAGLYNAGFRTGMEISVTGTSSNNNRFYISQITTGSPDIITTNISHGGLSNPVDETATCSISAGGFILEDKITTGGSILNLGGYIYTKKLQIDYFNNDDNTNRSSSNIRIITKELIFDDLSSKKNINAVYISHNPNSNIKVYIKTSNEGSFSVIHPEEEHDEVYRTYKYNVRAVNAQVCQIKIESDGDVDNYELDDISIVYRLKSPR